MIALMLLAFMLLACQPLAQTDTTTITTTAGSQGGSASTSKGATRPLYALMAALIWLVTQSR